MSETEKRGALPPSQQGPIAGPLKGGGRRATDADIALPGDGPVVKVCRECGTEFRTKNGATKWCPKHRRRYAREMRQKVMPETAERLVLTEDLLLRGYSADRAAQVLAKEWGIKPLIARRDYVDAVLRAWSGTARAEDREARRDKLRARFEDAYRRAATKRTLRKRTQVVPDKDGKPKVVTVTEEVDAPDFKAMQGFGELLVKLDGLGTVNVNQTTAHVVSSAMAAVIARRKILASGKRVVEATLASAPERDPLDSELARRGLLPRSGT